MVATMACLAGSVGAGAAEACLPAVCEPRGGWDNFRVDLGQMDDQ
jgi:hypothetical protein